MVTIATAEPYVREWEAQLRQILRLEIKRVIANPVEIQSYIVEFYNLARSVKTANAQDRGNFSDVTNFEQLMQLGRSGKLDANDSHIIHICDWLFTYAFQQRASDIHLEPRREVSNVRFRIDGALHQVYQIPTPVMAAMTSRIKIMGRMDVVEKRRPQDGRLKTISPGGSEVELRLSTMPTAFGEKFVMRIFDPDTLIELIAFSMRHVTARRGVHRARRTCSRSAAATSTIEPVPSVRPERSHRTQSGPRLLRSTTCFLPTR